MSGLDANVKGITTKTLFQFMKQQRKRPTFKKGDWVRRLTDGQVFKVDVMTKYGPQLVDQHGTFATSQFELVKSTK